MRRVTMFLLFVFVLPAMADSECPIGYTTTEYTQLEYIESTGTQYIDTGYAWKSLNRKAEVDILFTQILPSSHIFASTVTLNDTYDMNPYFGSANTLNCYIGQRSTFSTTLNTNTKYNLLFDLHSDNKLIFRMNGVEDVYTTDTIPTSNNTVYLLHVNGAPRTYYPAKAKVYSFKMWDDNVSVRSFIPAKRNSDNEIGMYDTITQTFFTNAGTGKFIAGPEKETEFMNCSICSPCPPNTYKDFVGNGECTPCPDAMVSPSGSKSATDCGRALWIGNKVLFMSSTPRTTTTLNIMDSDGNIFYGNLYSEK